MQWIKRLAVAAILLLVLLFGVLFSVQNSQTVSLDLLVIQFSEQRAALWILAAFALGGCGGLLASSVAILRLRSRSALLRRKLRQAEKELATLRTSAFKQ